LTRISLQQIARASESIDPVFLDSPQFESETIGGELGSRLVLKVETVNPLPSDGELVGAKKPISLSLVTSIFA
jgi:threonine dehydratase